MPRDVELAAWRGVWVIVEQDRGQAAAVSWELLGAGRHLADELGVELCAVVLGFQVGSLAREAFAYGADRVYLIDDPALAVYRVEAYSAGLVRLIERHRPEIVLLGATGAGRELAASVATAVSAGLTADTTELTIDREKRLLEATRPTFSGKQLATILCETWRPQMATVRPKVLPMPARREGRHGPIVRAPLGIGEEDLVTRLLQRIPAASDPSRLDVAEIVVAGGRGLGEARNFALLFELAEVLGGAVAATRPVVEAGWIGREHQVGQTGKTVRARLYFAIGISGAIQHLVGMRQSDVIVAVNRDQEAPMVRAADYAIVGDLFQVVPAVTEAFRQRLARRPAEAVAGGSRR